MALRIAVNRELESLESLLSTLEREIAGFFPVVAPEAGGSFPSISGAGRPHKKDPIATGQGGSQRGWLNQNARVAILAFHSLEDRLIKRAFVEWERHGWVSRLTRKPLVAGDAECDANPRARSAKLRSVRIAGV
ncbi:MAG: 16S rRNA (cytosine(1402)-N(4))-methyltransferase [Planctomycetes bacterium]|nr:16S rRNA (cytosine(1402)-N(4))-methyltransferase [Planctomycetota bacterium]